MESINVLLADDDDDDRFFFREALINTGKNLVLEVVKDGEELMTQLKDGIHKIPDVIFLDLNMPIKNGHDCLKEIRRDSKLKDIPVVIYSTASDDSQIESTYKEGANLYLIKPDSLDDLDKHIDKVFSLDCAKYKPQPVKDQFLFKY
ncbi:MAG TPA: response regulator [Saprospiraceae bacterium]|nr:response regulator [Saprospiraceae bacterium]